ncbi:rCG32374, partial [Rattus norvegicus]
MCVPHCDLEGRRTKSRCQLSLSFRRVDSGSVLCRRARPVNTFTS